MTVSDPKSQDFARIEEAARWCLRLSEGEMTGAARAQFTKWLTSNPAHRMAFDQAVVVWDEVSAAESSSEMLQLRVEALGSLRRAQRAQGRRRVLGIRTPWLLAASVLLAVLCGMLVWRYPSEQNFASAIGERRNVSLADGSALNLDASSEVVVRYSGAERTLQLLRGRAKFQVAKDARRPFVVYAADREIVATGTTFSVEILQKEVQVILYQGHVSVIGAGHMRSALVAGEELIGLISRAQVRIAHVDVARSLTWQSDQLEFVNEPLGSAVERVNRYARHPVSIGDDAAANEHISGIFTAGDTQAFIDGVSVVAALKAERRDDGTVILVSGHAQH